MVKGAELAVLPVHGPDRDAVVTPVRSVDEAAVWRNHDVRTPVDPAEAIRNGAHGLAQFEAAGLGVVGKGGERRGELVDHVHRLAVRGEGEMARTRPRLGARPRIGDGDQLAGGVERVGDHPVDAKVGCEDESTVRRGGDHVGVRLPLAIRIDARPLVLDHAGCRLETAIIGNRQRGDAAAAVIGDEHELTRGVDAEVARSRPTRRLPVEFPQRPGLRIAGVGDDTPLPLSLGHGVEVAFARSDGEVRWVDDVANCLDVVEVPGFGIEAVDADARGPALGWFSVRACIEEHGRVSSKCHSGTERQRVEESRPAGGHAGPPLRHAGKRWEDTQVLPYGMTE